MSRSPQRRERKSYVNFVSTTPFPDTLKASGYHLIGGYRSEGDISYIKCISPICLPVFILVDQPLGTVSKKIIRQVQSSDFDIEDSLKTRYFQKLNFDAHGLFLESDEKIIVFRRAENGIDSITEKYSIPEREDEVPEIYTVYPLLKLSEICSNHQSVLRGLSIVSKVLDDVKCRGTIDDYNFVMDNMNKLNESLSRCMKSLSDFSSYNENNIIELNAVMKEYEEISKKGKLPSSDLMKRKTAAHNLCRKYQYSEEVTKIVSEVKNMLLGAFESIQRLNEIEEFCENESKIAVHECYPDISIAVKGQK